MATIKSYTDLEQSKKLAEILPLESADMCWTNHCYGAIRSSMTISVKTVDKYKSLLDRFKDSSSIDVFYPAWSLAALLGILPSGYVIVKNYHSFYYVESRGHERSTNIFNNPIDACVEMIEKLHELNLL